MDRREALKRIGVGGATVVGASAVMSSPAFAFTNPTPTLAMTVTGAGSTATVTLSATASCPGSAVSSSQTIFSYSSALSTVFISPTGRKFRHSGVDFPTTAAGNVFTVDKTKQNNTADLFQNGDAFQAIVTVVGTYTCNYVGGSSTITGVTSQFTRTATYNAATLTWTVT